MLKGGCVSSGKKPGDELACYDAAPCVPPEETLAAHVYRSARAVGEALRVADGAIGRLRSGAIKLGCGDPPDEASKGLVADAAGHADDAEKLLQKVRELADLLGFSH